MGVYIKGMEMPKSCYGCPFFTQVDYWNENDEADILSKCKQTGEFTWESVNGYLPNCPLLPIPMHGRLVDADRLGFAMMDAANVDQALAMVDDAPTVIEAEEGET